MSMPYDPSLIPGSPDPGLPASHLDPSNYADWASLYGLSEYLDEYSRFGASGETYNYTGVKNGAGNSLEQALIALYNQGKISASDLQGYLNYLVYRGYDSSFEKWLDNVIALENTNSARNWEQQMAETELLRSADQLKTLGLSPSNVIQTGGSAVNPVSAAENVKTNMSQQRYEQRMGMTKSLISMVTGMASAGIGGAAMGIARNTLARQAMATANNATKALQNLDDRFEANRDFTFGKIANLELLNKYRR